jgi:hypothetical protein
MEAKLEEVNGIDLSFVRHWNFHSVLRVMSYERWAERLLTRAAPKGSS